MEILRRKLIYVFFIEHFIECAKVSQKFLAFHQSLVYLKQAERLCLLLSDDSFINEAIIQIEIIKQLKMDLETYKSNLIQGPELPRRESLIDSKKIKNRQWPQRRNSSEEIYSNTVFKSDENLSEDDNEDIEKYNKQPIKVDVHFASNMYKSGVAGEAKCLDKNEKDVNNVTKIMENLEIYDNKEKKSS
jgi:hypothetical protein